MISDQNLIECPFQPQAIVVKFFIYTMSSKKKTSIGNANAQYKHVRQNLLWHIQKPLFIVKSMI
jgi:hypothetical protein